jgi:hypothetical protein
MDYVWRVLVYFEWFRLQLWASVWRVLISFGWLRLQLRTSLLYLSA